MAEAILTGEGLRQTYGSRVVLDVGRVEVPEGGTLAVLGPSGSGKSTLLSVLGLLLRPDEGRVLLRGRPVDSRDKEARMNMAAVFQRPFLFKGTVGRNVSYGLRLRGVPKTERVRRVAAALERVGLAGWEERSALTLSGGEAQRVALARALVLEPCVLLLDEPMASLDAMLKTRLTEEFVDILRTASVSALWVTHDQNEAMAVADRVAIMRDGRLVTEGLPDDVMALPHDEWTAAFLGVEPSASGVVRSNEEGLLRIDAGGTDVFALGTMEPGTAVRFGIRPEDVLLFESGETLPASTARNHLNATVEAISPRGSTFRVAVRAGSLSLAVAVSRASCRDLGLSPGSEVLAVFKASAVRVRRETLKT